MPSVLGASLGLCTELLATSNPLTPAKCSVQFGESRAVRSVMFTSLLRTTMTRCGRLWYTPWSSPQGGDALAQSSFLRHPHHLWPLPSMTPPLVMVRDCSPHLRIHKRLILPRSLLLLIRPSAVPRQQLDQWPVIAIRTAEHCRAGLHDHDEVAREVKGTGEIRAAARATGKEQCPYSVPPPLCETAAAALLQRL